MKPQHVAAGAVTLLGAFLLVLFLALIGAREELAARDAVYRDNAIVYNYLRICQAELAGEPVPYGAEPPASYRNGF